MSPARLGRVNGALAVPIWVAVALLVVWLLGGCVVVARLDRQIDIEAPEPRPSEKAPDGKGRRD
jgi:hypothetical protein